MLSLERLFPGRALRARSLSLYGAIVGRAREAVFYRDLGVPDTLDGRFEMIVLHLFLIVDRLRRIGRDGNVLARALLETMVDDMDSAVREMGVGDLSVGRRVKAMAAAYNGRATAYGKAMENADPGELHGSLRRNLFGTVEAPEAAKLAAIARYMRDQRAALDALDDRALLAGELHFIDPPNGSAVRDAGARMNDDH